MPLIEHIVKKFKTWDFCSAERFLNETKTGYFIQNNYGHVVLVFYIEKDEEWCTHEFGCFKQDVNNYNKNILSLDEVKKEFFKKPPISLIEFLLKYGTTINGCQYLAKQGIIFIRDLTNPGDEWHSTNTYDGTNTKFSKLENTQCMYINGTFIEIK